jgi:hypothetical protein
MLLRDVIASAQNLVYRPVPSNPVASSNKGLTYHNIVSNRADPSYCELGCDTGGYQCFRGMGCLHFQG